MALVAHAVGIGFVPVASVTRARVVVATQGLRRSKGLSYLRRTLHPGGRTRRANPRAAWFPFGLTTALRPEVERRYLDLKTSKLETQGTVDLQRV
jgi:hypothetical protein